MGGGYIGHPAAAGCLQFSSLHPHARRAEIPSDTTAGRSITNALIIVITITTVHLRQHLREKVDVAWEQDRAIPLESILRCCLVKKPAEQGMVCMLGLNNKPLLLGSHVHREAPFWRHSAAGTCLSLLQLLEGFVDDILPATVLGNYPHHFDSILNRVSQAVSSRL
ncbi:hypothetical protein CRG98_023021 [Punica granatum]|uniref:Uncharacterized protein n=1 Tax=Punica granatum TaxID=22663 RepID=A0A2I0JK09_PUNGR|nr:hypothetical protein CRG98_023021 [Punica granatum]